MTEFIRRMFVCDHLKIIVEILTFKNFLDGSENYLFDLLDWNLVTFDSSVLRVANHF